MTNIHQLLQKLTTDENQLCSTQFLAPAVPGGQVRVRLNGLIYQFTPRPKKLGGWGIFQPLDTQLARRLSEPNLAQIEQYLNRLRPLRLRLVHRLRGQTWLTYPNNEADMQQKLGWVKPVVVHLVTAGNPFDPIISRWDGSAFWFETVDYRADPIMVSHLQNALNHRIQTADLNFKGLTPEMRTAYDLATQQIDEFSPQQRDRNQLQAALKLGGGKLQQFQDQGDYWTVEWLTSTGEFQVSAIAKSDLTVISAGICLDGGDRDFDLQSLVGVIEQRGY